MDHLVLRKLVASHEHLHSHPHDLHESLDKVSLINENLFLHIPSFLKKQMNSRRLGSITEYLHFYKYLHKLLQQFSIF